ncbi:hypothetical protein [Streptomyces sp. AMCC400023]|uniref:hypothetical protein n=1 Tax=Streptomyces sp. AMCC400023 TaxID=2056258 RepID=UPI001F386BC2|nr:hypothetical protein [Streptomyces sp. AMCC400023]UJV43825.1 hypothetical protein CVT30_31915 [Streptomyces sp. AMCC400023]
MRTTAEHLKLVIHHWRDLVDALGGRSAPTWPPAGRMNDHLRNTADLDAEQLEAERHRALAQRTLERDPAQIGERPIPIRLTIHETMQVIHADLVHCADAIAGSVQRPVMSGPPANPVLPKDPRARRVIQADHARRALLAMQDRRDPRRWSWTRTRPAAPLVALWLLGRIQGAPGPFRPLTGPQLDHIGSVARSCAMRVEDALDVGERRATLARPCPTCGGRLTLHGGAGALPVARCSACGHVWAGQPAVA